MFNVVNNQFQQFYNFAQASSDNTIAKIGVAAEGATLGERSIVAKSGDYIGKFRFQASRDVNDSVRALFKQTVVDMFGGEDNIPQSVKDAMLLKDYGKGKPLTARRIKTVATAIQELGRQNAFEAEGTQPGEMARLAEEAGYARKDFGKLNTAANLYVKAFGGSLKKALELAIDNSSEVHAAMEAGKLYMKDAETFRRGVIAHAPIAAMSTANKALVTAAVTSGDFKCLAKIAKNRATQLRTMLDDPATLLNEYVNITAGNDPLATLRQALESAASRFDDIARRIENGEVMTEKDVVGKVIGRENLDQVENAFKPIVTMLRASAGGIPGLEEVADMLQKLSSRITAEQDGLDVVFRGAYAERELPNVLQKLEDASREAEQKTGKPLDIPETIVSSLKVYISRTTFEATANVDRFCRILAKNGDAALHFNDDQKARLKALIVRALGAEKAEQALPKLINELETAFFAECLDDKSGERNVQNRPETVLAHFEKHPDVFKVMNVGLDTSRMAQVKTAIKAEMDVQLANVLKKPPTDMASISSGMMPQSVREYNMGYVTFNGQNLHYGRTGRQFALADNSERRGYAEFLEEKFNDAHVKMRQTVSFVCGMALGLGGAIDAILREGVPGNADLVTGMPINNCLTNHNTNIMPGARHPDDNYDIAIADNGDVTVKLTHYFTATVNMLISDDGKLTSLSMLNGQSPTISLSKMTATVKITNATDAELGDNMPQFEVTDFTKEPVDVE